MFYQGESMNAQISFNAFKLAANTFQIISATMRRFLFPRHIHFLVVSALSMFKASFLAPDRGSPALPRYIWQSFYFIETSRSQ